MTMQPVRPNRRTPSRSSRRSLAALAVTGPVLLLVLAACGSGTSTPASAPAPTTPAPSASAPPGVVGLAAAVSATSLEVQNPSSGQVTVNFSTGTRITAQQAGTLSSVVVGDCLTASGAPTASGDGLTARTVTVSQPDGGSCTAAQGGFGGGRGVRPSGMRPSGAPRPSGSATATANLTGTVTTVTGSTVTVTGVLRTGGPQASASPATRTVSVTAESTTRFTTVVPVTSSALKVGECVAATGSSSDIGAVNATSISIFQSGQNACATFGGSGGTGSSSGGSNG